MKLTINRKRWYRGYRFGSRLIREEDNKQCCLGFYGRALKIPAKKMVNVGGPSGVDPKYRSRWGKLLNEKGQATKLCLDFYAANDAVGNGSIPREDYSETKREKDITRLFKKLGVTVVFTN